MELKNWHVASNVLYLEALDQRSFLSADVGPRPPVKVHVEVVARAAGVLANETFLLLAKTTKNKVR